MREREKNGIEVIKINFRLYIESIFASAKNVGQRMKTVEFSNK